MRSARCACARSGRHSCVVRTVVFPVVRHAQEEAKAPGRGLRKQSVEGDEEALVVYLRTWLESPLTLPPLVLKRPDANNVEAEALSLVQHLRHPRVLVRAFLRAAGVREVVAVRTDNGERRPIARIDEAPAVRGDDPSGGGARLRERGGEQRGEREENEGGDGREEKARGTRRGSESKGSHRARAGDGVHGAGVPAHRTRARVCARGAVERFPQKRGEEFFCCGSLYK